MGLLDSVVGAVGGALAGQLGQAVGGALGGTGGATGGASAQMIEGLIAALTQGGTSAGTAGAGLGGLGGLAGLVQQMQQGGMGDVVGSWVSTGQNLPISAEQLQGALGGETMGQLARSMGLDVGQAAGPLAQLLPQVVDAMTPNGQLPGAGADLGSLLPQVLGKLMNPAG